LIGLRERASSSIEEARIWERRMTVATCIRAAAGVAQELLLTRRVQRPLECSPERLGLASVE